MKDADTTKPTRNRTKSSKIDWSRFDAMTDEQRHQAALADPDAQPLTEEDMDRMKRTPRTRIVRRALGLSQEEFATRYQIPIGTLRDWEQGRVEPDQAARAYLKVIAREPETTHKALQAPPNIGCSQSGQLNTALTKDESKKLEEACRELPNTSVQIEEEHVARSPVLLLMSSVLSLNRRWYEHAIPARAYFVRNYEVMKMSLREFRALAEHESNDRTDWSRLAKKLWNRNEWGKARMLTELVDYFLKWKEQHAPEESDLGALKRWSSSVTSDQFVGRIKGLGPRAYEQVQWYLDGNNFIKLDRHVVAFVKEVIGRSLIEREIKCALIETAKKLGLSPTSLDVRIWDHMQRRNRANVRSSCTTRIRDNRPA